MTQTVGKRPPPDRLLTLAELADYLQVPPKTLYTWRSKRTGPAGVKVGKHLRYRMRDVEAWLDEQSRAATAA